MITYKSLIQYFDKVCAEHSVINSFTYGEMNFQDDDKFNQYPAVHLSPSVTSIDDQVVVYGCDIVVFDRYDVDEDKMNNEMNCLSDALLLLQDLCAEFSNGQFFIHEDTNIRLNIPVSATPFIDTKPDNVSGWSTSFEVITPNEIDRCNIPYYESDILHGKDYTLPVKLPEDFAWWSMDKIHAKAAFDASGEIISLKPLVESTIGGDTLTIEGNGVTFDNVNNSISMNNDKTIENCNLVHDVTSNHKSTWVFKIIDFPSNIESTANHFFWFGDVGSFVDGLVLRFTIEGFLNVFSLTDGTNLDTIKIDLKDIKRRKEPLVFALVIESDNSVKVIAEDGQEFTLPTTFSMSTKRWAIGSSIAFVNDFKFKELMFINEEPPLADVKILMEWLKYR